MAKVHDQKRLFHDLATAAKSFKWAPHKPSLGGPFGKEHDPEDWRDALEESLRIQVPSGAIFHLQFTLERRGSSTETRVKIRGKRVTSFTQKIQPVQRATFNSETVDEKGYVLQPKGAAMIAPAMAARLPGPACPFWEGNHVRVGVGTPYVILRRFIVALSVIEDAKGRTGNQPLPFEPDEEHESALFEPDDLQLLREIEEGRTTTVTRTQRSRCKRLLGEAQEHFRGLSDDGVLRCTVCRWAPPVATRGEIVQIHHLKQLRTYPRNGLRLTQRQALENLVPLCPNCHRTLESHPDSGLYTIEELRHAQPPTYTLTLR